MFNPFVKKAHILYRDIIYILYTGGGINNSLKLYRMCEKTMKKRWYKKNPNNLLWKSYDLNVITSVTG